MTASPRVHGPALVGVGLTLVVVGLLPRSPSAGPQPAAVSPAPPPTAAPAAAPAPPPSPPEERDATPQPQVEPDVVGFYATFAAAVRRGDAATLHELLHPLVRERYGSGQCRSYLAGVSDPGFDVEVVGSPVPERWVWELDGRRTEVPDAVAVAIRVSAGGADAGQVAHLAPSDGGLRWFTDCGEPVP